MDDLIKIFTAYGTRPDANPAPTPLQCAAVATEVRRARAVADDLAAALERSLAENRRHIGLDYNDPVINLALAKYNGETK